MSSFPEHLHGTCTPVHGFKVCVCTNNKFRTLHMFLLKFILLYIYGSQKNSTHEKCCLMKTNDFKVDTLFTLGKFLHLSR